MPSNTDRSISSYFIAGHLIKGICKRTKRRVGSKARGADSRDSFRSDSLSTSGTDESVEPLTNVHSLCGTTIPESSTSSCEEPQQVSNESPTVATRIPIHVRVEQEKLRLSLTKGCQDTVGVKASSSSLRFQDTDGRNIQYNLRSSKKKNRSNFLELHVDGEKSKRGKHMIIYDDASNAIHDGGHRFLLPSSDVQIIMKSLSLICKIGQVKFDGKNASSPALGKVMSDLDCNKVLSSAA
mmetsp:Transcript_28526/g.60789  ORF Transcript_28526/g.60789 Transcript_28526/m.60789 type:complete len:239 (+) Transcript_28526:158-874(+)